MICTHSIHPQGIASSFQAEAGMTVHCMRSSVSPGQVLISPVHTLANLEPLQLNPPVAVLGHGGCTWKCMSLLAIVHPV